jgi:hypothetical protein
MIYWRPKDHSNEDLIVTDEEIAESEREDQEWAKTEEGVRVLEELHQEHVAKLANPHRLSNNVDFTDMPLLFARAVQKIVARPVGP